MRLSGAVLGAVLVLTGCGVAPQTQPEALPPAAPQPVEPSGRPEPLGPAVTVFFVRGAALAPAARASKRSDAASAVQQLVVGPSRPEVLSGLRTALAPQPLTVDEGLPGGLTAVSVTREFTGVTGGNQLLAVAQVVWTLTELPGTAEVRFLVAGVPVEVPTDEELTDQPVDRTDYRSVAPVSPGPDADGVTDSASRPPPD